MRTAAEELALAAQCDANGAHDDAVNALARATKLGDVEATTRLAKRLIVGNDAPLLPTEGARLLFDAVNRGGAEAAAKLAVLAAAGAYVEPSLDHAFRLISLSAQRGWAPARSQLLALTEDRALASVADGAATPENYWQRLTDSIDIEGWTQAPAGKTLHESPLIRSFETLISDKVCQWLIDVSHDRLKRALVYDAVGGKDHADKNRTNSWAQFDLMGSELIHLLVQKRMEAASGLPSYNMEATAVLHYAVGEEITNHFDFVDPSIPNYEQELEKNGQRIMTFLIYLNDDYEHGETEFPKLGVMHKGRRGEGLYFINALANGAPDPRTVHAGRRTVNGEKWIVSQFVRNRRVLGL
ncbi:prolyl hydroxylase family protein [Candidatus Rariloculus sp.]|uniref:prolyl hydroxylase family protein n=1 Tax=Candidatus Rariloculus sp. TaxID=3101265 RepID=UPI003D0CCAC3